MSAYAHADVPFLVRPNSSRLFLLLQRRRQAPGCLEVLRSALGLSWKGPGAAAQPLYDFRRAVRAEAGTQEAGRMHRTQEGGLVPAGGGTEHLCFGSAGEGGGEPWQGRRPPVTGGQRSGHSTALQERDKGCADTRGRLEAGGSFSFEPPGKKAARVTPGWRPGETQLLTPSWLSQGK